MNFGNKVRLWFSILVITVGTSLCDKSSMWGVEQNWGYITVRPHAHMFYWLFYTTAQVSNYTERPLMIWLQGGPGMPSSGYGVFSELGPVDLNEDPREHTWVKDYNVLFLDNPIAVGFSYFSKNTTEAASNNTFIAKDLVKFLELFLTENPEFENIPTYIFGESYGGKMVVDFAYQLNLRIRRGKIKCNLKGIGLGDAYISPWDYVSLYGDIAYHLGFLEDKGRNYMNSAAMEIKNLTDQGDYMTASEKQLIISKIYSALMGGTDLYNFNTKMTPLLWSSLWKDASALSSFMNEKIKPALGIPEKQTWHFLNYDAFIYLQDDFFRPVTDKIESLLNSTDIKIVVYNGVLDLLVNTLGTSNWLKNLNWSKSVDWLEAPNVPFLVNGTIEGILKTVGNLAFYSVHRAGHSVPIDNPAAMKFILETLDNPPTERVVNGTFLQFTYYTD